MGPRRRVAFRPLLPAQRDRIIGGRSKDVHLPQGGRTELCRKSPELVMPRQRILADKAVLDEGAQKRPSPVFRHARPSRQGRERQGLLSGRDRPHQSKPHLDRLNSARRTPSLAAAIQRLCSAIGFQSMRHRLQRVSLAPARAGGLPRLTGVAARSNRRRGLASATIGLMSKRPFMSPVPAREP